MNIPVVPGNGLHVCKWHPKLEKIPTIKSDNSVRICAQCDYTSDGAGPPAEAFIRRATP